jgi:hypothetical protein
MNIYLGGMWRIRLRVPGNNFDIVKQQLEKKKMERENDAHMMRSGAPFSHPGG